MAENRFENGAEQTQRWVRQPVWNMKVWDMALC